MATIRKFEELEIWQVARQLCRRIYPFVAKMNEVKDFELAKQINRSSGSAMDNIAEGFGRGGNCEFKNYLSISSGSSNEVQSQLYRMLDRGHISQSEFDEMYALTQKLINKTGSFMGYLSGIEHRGVKFKSGK